MQKKDDKVGNKTGYQKKKKLLKGKGRKEGEKEKSK